MKSIKFCTAVLITVLFTSCMSKEEKEYDKKYWEHQTKMLEIEYQKEIVRLGQDARIQLILNRNDSIIKSWK